MLPEKIEYRVRPVTRYVVTRYAENDRSAGSSPKGEFDNEQAAYDVAYAVCKLEHQQLGWPLDDERIKYPEAPADDFPHTAATSRGWMDTAAQHSRNEEFYRGLLGQIGEMFGDEAYRSDDGSLQDSVLALKVPGLVAKALADRRRPFLAGVNLPNENAMAATSQAAVNACTNRIG